MDSLHACVESLIPFSLISYGIIYLSKIMHDMILLAHKMSKIIFLVFVFFLSFFNAVKTAPSFADAAVGRIAQGTKILAEGGYEKIFRQTFETVPEEQLQNSYACYLSTSAGPVMGTIYVSTAKLAFCSDNPLSYKTEDKTEWSYYKVRLDGDL